MYSKINEILLVMDKEVTLTVLEIATLIGRLESSIRSNKKDVHLLKDNKVLAEYITKADEEVQNIIDSLKNQLVI